MPANDDIETSTLSTNNIYIPVSSAKTPLSWDNNDATILGLLYETGKYYKSKGLFQTLLKHRAVALSNGRLAVEDPHTVYFITDACIDDRSFDDPCPPTATRVLEYNREVAAGTMGAHARPITNLTTIPKEQEHTVILAKHCVEKEDSLFLHSLSHVFGECESSEKMTEDADGSGLAFLELLRIRGANAKPRDKALVSSKFNAIIRNGVNGELTLHSFNSFLKTYKAAKRNIEPASRPSDEAEIEMISIIAIKDPASRELFELQIAMHPPNDLDEASEILFDMLRGRVRCEEIDQLESDGGNAKSLVLATPKPAPEVMGLTRSQTPAAALSNLGLDFSALKPKQLAALISALAPPDPRKTQAGEKPKLDIPRDEWGKPTKWIEGMATCRCKVNGGKHLFKDCPKAKEKAAKKALSADALAGAAHLGLDEAQLRSALVALLNIETAAAPNDGGK